MLLLRCLCLLGLFTADIRASSSNHWVVTETGLVESKDDSPFVMAMPFDVLSLLNQETRWHNMFNIYDDLVLRQLRMNGLWNLLEEQSDINTHITEDEYCKAVGDVENIDWYTTIVEEGKNMGISERDFLLYAIEEFGDTEVPDCKKISSLTFSMSAFEHLEGMINRGHLNATPDTTLPQIFTPVRTVNQYGHWLSAILRRNTTSWLHYNLAAIYWRIKGNMPKALECSRRAVHYAPRYYKTIPLLCMGSILHRCRKTEDAIVILGAAVDHAPSFPYSHFALGEAFAVMGDFNSSLKHFNISLELRQNFALAAKYRNAVLCHINMLTKMQYTQRTLIQLAKELEEFRALETQWFKIHAAFLKTMKHEKEYNYKNVEKNCVKIEEITFLKIKELQKDRDRNTLVQYLVNTPEYNEKFTNEKGVVVLNIAYDLDRAVKRVVKQSSPPNINLADLTKDIKFRNETEVLKELGPMPSFPDMFPEPIKYKSLNKAERKAPVKMSFEFPEISMAEHLELAILKKSERGKVFYPSNMKVNRNKEDFDTDPEWPSNIFCQQAKPNFPDSIDTVYPVFMPFEHKGISLKTLLTDRIGVPALVEHDLPWHPPLCPNDKELSLYTSRKGMKVQLVSEAIATDILRFKLVTYVSHDNYEILKNMQDAEIGQRIHTAMEKKLASKWILYTLASLYWRVRGNTVNALNCLLTASRNAESRFRDVVLTSLASVLLEMGFWDDALSTAEDAYRVNPYEPPTNFLLAQIHMVKKNQKAQIVHMKQVVRLEPWYMGGYARNLLNAWSCIAKQINTLRELGVTSADIDGDDLCAETEPGVSMVCERDGTNCRLTNRHCGPGSSRESSTLVRMLELKNDVIQKPPPRGKITFESAFNKYINIMPMDRSDKHGHQRSYDLMVKTLSEVIKTCGKGGCGVDAEALNLKFEECNFQAFQLEYWLHILTFKQDLIEPEITMLTEMTAITPSNKKVPECRIPVDANGDFFLSRILSVETAGWSATPILMQEVGALYRHLDFALLGAKLADYVDAEPSSWAGLLAAGRWCGAAGRGACAARCLAAAHAHSPRDRAHVALRPLIAILQLQSKPDDALDIAFLGFYTAPKSKVEALLVGISQFYVGGFDEAFWMYRYALAIDFEFTPASACLHTAMCIMAFGKESFKYPTQQTPTWAE